MVNDNSQTTISLPDRWAALKAKGRYTKAEIDAIDEAVRWQQNEPKWWLEMMKARQSADNV